MVLGTEPCTEPRYQDPEPIASVMGMASYSRAGATRPGTPGSCWQASSPALSQEGDEYRWHTETTSDRRL